MSEVTSDQTVSAPPLVSVVIPAFNAEAFLTDAVESVFRQDHRPIELIVVDDASTDGTAALIRSFVDAAPVGVKVGPLFLSENRGAAGALAAGFDAATGGYLCWLSADDTFVEPAKLARQVMAIESGAAMSYFKGAMIGPSLDSAVLTTARYLYRFDFLERRVEAWPTWRLFMLMFANPINGSSVMIKTDVLRTEGGFDPALGNVDADGDLWMRYSSLGLRFQGIDGPGVFYRTHAGQTSAQGGAMAEGMALSRIRLLRALESTGRLRSALGSAWLLLPLIRRWRLYAAVPLASAYLARALVDRRNRLPWIARRMAAGLLADIERAGLMNEADLASVMSRADRASESAGFRHFVERLGERR